MAEEKTCLICQQKFLPSRYRKEQQVCSRRECQRQRQLNNLAAWRAKNPGYFKFSQHDSSWAELYRGRARRWRKKNQAKIKKYRRAHKQEHREYMREYMRRLRQRMV
ncbi:MAG: hypothetical protein JW714_04995 [Candidatus Omnitrophica bacterium]|nr:hypothetical protein [Candidatus Omnitrophota bacterium]